MSHEAHEMLPWYMAGTLESEKVVGFRDHLVSCEPCRREMALLEDLRRELDRHGQVFLKDHMTAEQLVDMVQGEQTDAAFAVAGEHLALCSSCTEEARWVEGVARYEDAPAEASPARKLSSGVRRTAWIAGALIVIVILLLWLFR